MKQTTISQMPPNAQVHRERVGATLQHLRETRHVVDVRVKEGDTLVRLQSRRILVIAGWATYRSQVLRAQRTAPHAALGISLVTECGPLAWCGDHPSRCACQDCTDFLGN
jgi:hypothetical protein